MKFSNLGKRLLFVIPAIPLGWWFVNSQFPIIHKGVLPDPNMTLIPGHILAIILTLLAAKEYVQMLSISFKKNGFWLSYIWLGFQFLSYFIPEFSLSFRYDTFLLLIAVAAEAVIWGEKSGRWRRASLMFSGTVFLSIVGFALLNFYKTPFQTVFASKYSMGMFSQMGIVTVLTSVFMTDSIAYFAGKAFGKTHFSSISPKKTIEGSIAGLVASIIVATLGWIFFATPQAHVKYSKYFGVILGIIIGITAQIGDLLVSLIKRYFHVKDSSQMIPGHGGILDRFDSMFFTAPILNLFLIIVTRIIK